MSKPKLTLLRLNFHEPLHLSRGLPGYDQSQEILHSDTLKSALFVAALQLFGEEGLQEHLTSDNLKDFFSKFQLSSALYYLHTPEGKTLYFFPVPERKLHFQGADDPQKRKELKKIAFLEQSLFEMVLRGEENSVELDELSFSKGGKLVCLGDTEDISKAAVFKTDLYQHVHIPRDLGEDSVPYYVEKLYFEDNAGLFTLLQVEDKDFQKDVLLPAFRLLADNGIGTDRNTGQGHFTLEEEEQEFTLEVPNNPEMQLALSLYLPQKEEVGEGMEDSRYKLLRRGGWISSPQSDDHLTLRKKSVYMFTEGSFFKYQESRQGKVVDIAPNNEKLKDNEIQHPVWRDGQALFVGMKLPEDNN